jgi:membrane protease YdiL (CAAX protease family)
VSAPPRPATSEWAPWLAPVALVGGIVLALLGALVVDVPALALGATVTSSHTSPGVTLANTFVQDLAFVAAAVLSAYIGAHRVSAADLGLRPPRRRWRAAGWVFVLWLTFLLASAVWAAIVHPKTEKLLEQLGANEGTTLLVLSAVLTCVVAPMCEEILFRGFIYTALRNWRGVLPAAILAGLLFGAVHAGSAPAEDLVPLAALGFGLCLLYQHTGSLYPCMFAHSLNNSIAFASLEGWSVGQGALLIVAGFAGVAVILYALQLIGVTSSRPAGVAPET